jgi:DNA-binding CsgD family transcriptional regulator
VGPEPAALSAALNAVRRQLHECERGDRAARVYELVRARSVGAEHVGRAADVLELLGSSVIVTWVDSGMLAVYPSVELVRGSLCDTGQYLLCLLHSYDQRPSGRLAFELSPREQASLKLVAEGLTNKEIARRLNVSPASIKSYLGTASKKLGARNRAQAAMLASSAGVS